MKKMLLLLLPLCLFANQLPFVILIPSYNNEKFCEENLFSALNQNYCNYRILYVNDASTDNTLNLVESFIEKNDAKNRVQLIDNPKRRYSLANIYYTIHNEVSDEEIVVMLDGDDELAHPNVLNVLNSVYQNKEREIWLAYSNFQCKKSKEKGWGRTFPDEIVKRNKFRSYVHIPTHVRTFYGWLFKRIAKQDLLYRGDFYKMTGDSAIILPMLEMARDHHTFINKILYIYNDQNPISDHQINWKKQMDYNKHIRKRAPYSPIEAP
ncbi:MAG: glycosyltransferase family A protein [Candidatus Algichlamydia australiensis]|nr:glycosyltransferase family A protein [Chlamydiales bacterium]